MVGAVESLWEEDQSADPADVVSAGKSKRSGARIVGNRSRSAK